jgi:hypothetical protein
LCNNIKKDFYIMGNFFKKIKKGLEKLGDTIANTAGDVAKWGVNAVGEVTEEVTRVVAGDKAADKLEKVFDERIEPAVKRGIKGVVSAVNPLSHIGNIIEHGLIDGVSKTFAESTQDIIGATTRLVAGEEGEKKFDEFYDRKVQRWIEMATRIIGTAALSVVPGGQFVLAADLASEVGSLAYRVSQGHKANWWDALEIGGSAFGVATVGKAAGTTVREALRNGSTRIVAQSATMAGAELALGNTATNHMDGKRGKDLLSINKGFFNGKPTTKETHESDQQKRSEGEVYLNGDLYKIENGTVYYTPQQV